MVGEIRSETLASVCYEFAPLPRHWSVNINSTPYLYACKCFLMYVDIFVCEGAEDLTEVTDREPAQEMRKGRWSNGKSAAVE